MDFDDMLEELGELGRFQITTYTLVCLPVLFAAANSLSYVFTAGVPNYRCFIPECEEAGNTHYETPWTDWAIPAEGDSNDVISTKSTLCDMYKVNETYYNASQTCTKDIFTDQIIQCNQWVFDETESTIVNEWNITCTENQWKLSLIGSSHFAGIVVGSGLFGVLADRYGRKIIFIACILIMSLTGVLQVLSPEYITFVVLVFLNALGTSGVYPLAFIIGVEMVGKRKREVTGIVLNYFYAVGEALVALFAWYTKNWIYLQLIVAAPPFLFLIYHWMVPESVRWLLANDKQEKAKQIICKAAKVNNVILSSNVMDALKEVAPLHEMDKASITEDKMLPVIKEMITSKTLLLRFAIVYFIWAVNAFVYYGLSINSTSLSGNKYINFALVSLIEIPGYTIAWVSIQKIGRRYALILSLILCGLTCTLTIFVPSGMTWAIIVLFLCGKLGITSSFGIVYVHTAEMLPTIVRSGGVGSASTIARLGALLAPFVPLLGVYFKPLPMLLFGGTALTAGLLALKLPETLGIKLPETVEEAKKL
ncbi:organic cation transporter protein [Aethina tumida]|uniref:organic cation transporter protein n=1 Tax=Aethina tumida TaxID=116153 RepID=UPI002148C759|nr:organic cation transporter protein [Aethina tumida]